MLTQRADHTPAFKRPQASWPALKIGYADKKKSLSKSYTAQLNYGTHTTLRCCFAYAIGNPQKTALLGARPVSRWRLKALFCVLSDYMSGLLSSYINNLTCRWSNSSALKRED
jgi:hypothetical protein